MARPRRRLARSMRPSSRSAAVRLLLHLTLKDSSLDIGSRRICSLSIGLLREAGMILCVFFFFFKILDRGEERN